MHNLIDEQIPSDLKQKLQAKSINKFSKPSKNSLTDFIKSTYTTTDQLQDKFQQPNLEEILNICKFKNKDQAIKVLYETLNYVEILWNQMIINKTIEYLKVNTQAGVFSMRGSVNIKDVFKSLKCLYTNETKDYSNFLSSSAVFDNNKSLNNIKGLDILKREGNMPTQKSALLQPIAVKTVKNKEIKQTTPIKWKSATEIISISEI